MGKENISLQVNAEIGFNPAKTTIESVSKEVIPYIIGLVAVAVLLIFAPQIIMWLPSLAGL